MKITPDHFVAAQVDVLRDGRFVRLPSPALVPGDIIIAEPGTLACDAVLLQGEVIVDENMLTGESVPVRKVGAAQAGGREGPALPPRGQGRMCPRRSILRVAPRCPAACFALLPGMAPPPRLPLIRPPAPAPSPHTPPRLPGPAGALLRILRRPLLRPRPQRGVHAVWRHMRRAGARAERPVRAGDGRAHPLLLRQGPAAEVRRPGGARARARLGCRLPQIAVHRAIPLDPPSTVIAGPVHRPPLTRPPALPVTPLAPAPKVHPVPPGAGRGLHL
jgi:hypothetical protein